MRKWVIGFLCIASSIAAAEPEPIVHYRALFSPRDHLAEELIGMIDQERESIKTAVYCLTHRKIVKAFERAKQRGVDVQVVIDPFSLRAKSVIKQMQEPPFPIFVWAPAQTGSKKKKALMHDKFCVFGKDRVWTGSFNFTLDANALHQENALIVENKALASSYLSEFERLKNSCCEPLSIYLSKQ